MGETRVDLQHLLEDLRDAYTGSLEETILTEITANALDSGATRISLQPRAADATLTVVDDGRGMKRRDLGRYHDVAASSKARGEGIGFAGVGIKLGLLVAEEVVTETRRGATHAATTWRLATRYRAPWKWIPPPGLTSSRGTAVQLRLSNPLSPLLDPGYLETALRTHFAPLLDPDYDDLLRPHYPNGITLEVGRPLARSRPAIRDQVTIPIRMGRKRLPSAIAILQRHDHPLPEDQQGIGISTFGKVIKRGWDWLGLTPASAWRVTGLVEAPELAACLTLSKNDFIRSGPRGAAYLAYRKAIQEVVSRQLSAWGDSREGETRPKTLRLERDLERVLEDLADDFPLLRSLVDHRSGGQKRLPLPGRGDQRVPGPLFANIGVGGEDGGAAGVLVGAEPEPRITAEPPVESAPPGEDAAKLPPSPDDDESPSARTPSDAGGGDGNAAASGALGTVPGRRRPARYGLMVQFESRPDDTELGRLVDSTIWINDAHPAYARAAASRSSGYHSALTVALALAPLAVDASEEHAFITQFLAHWGASSAVKRPRRSRPGKRR
ncbi:MAG: ATP-binding protein [Acidobacteria bacterium]|nr:ATP-binding protein [Acidobacteriota bacterium]